MAQVAALPDGLIGAPGGDISESLGEQVARPVHEGGTITNRGDVHHVAALVYQLIQYVQAAALIRGRHASDRWPPRPVRHASVGDKLRVSQSRLSWAWSKIEERSHVLQ